MAGGLSCRTRLIVRDGIVEAQVDLQFARQRPAASEAETVGLRRTGQKSGAVRGLASGFVRDWFDIVEIEFEGVGLQFVLNRTVGRQSVDLVDLELERCAVAQRKQPLLLHEAVDLVGSDAKAGGGFVEQQKFTGHDAFRFRKQRSHIRQGQHRGGDCGQTPSGRKPSLLVVVSSIIRVHRRRHTRVQPVFPAGPPRPVISAFQASFSVRRAAVPGS